MVAFMDGVMTWIREVALTVVGVVDGTTVDAMGKTGRQAPLYGKVK